MKYGANEKQTGVYRRLWAYEMGSYMGKQRWVKPITITGPAVPVALHHPIAFYRHNLTR